MRHVKVQDATFEQGSPFFVVVGGKMDAEEADRYATAFANVGRTVSTVPCDGGQCCEDFELGGQIEFLSIEEIMETAGR